MNLEPLFLKLDRIAGGRNVDYTVEPEQLDAPKIKRAFVVITWLLAAEFVLGALAIVIAFILLFDGQTVPLAVWMRGLVVLGMTVTLFYFSWRAQKGYYWAYSRLKLFSKIFPVVTLVMAAIPGLYPVWMITEQIIFSLIMIGVADYLSSDYMRDAFPKPVKPVKPAKAQKLVS